MCDRCEKLEKDLQLEAKRRITPTRWWVGIAVTVIIFLTTQVFLYGKIVSKMEDHIDRDPTHKELIDEFVRKEFLKETVIKRLDTIEDMVRYLYEEKKNGNNR